MGHLAVLSQYGACGSGLVGREVVYRLNLASPMDYLSINLNTSADLLLFVLPDVYPADCLSMGQSVLLSSVQPGTYYFVVDGYDLTDGDYTLGVLCVPPSMSTATPTLTPTGTSVPSPTPTEETAVPSATPTTVN